MNVEQLIEYLKTLNPKARVLIGNSENPSQEITERDIEKIDENTYII